jgi:hypothetical protein
VRLLPFLALTFACRTGDKIEEEEILDTGDVTETVDADADGYDASEDCDDANSVVNPGAEEICDGVDNNCDGEVDEGVTTTFYADLDGDGFGDADSFTSACEIPAGYVATGTDCDDLNPEVYPSSSEQCDGIDNDCDGEIDEDVRYDWFADADGDGFGDSDSAYETCDPPPGYVTDDTDCDDTEEAAFPGGTEVCDTVDNDCDGETDEDVTTTYYQDTDGDGFGIADTTTSACDLPTGYAADPGDCDDADGAISPNATEVCDDLDNDCDGDVDSDAIDQATFYADSDADGFGDATASATDCDTPSGYTTDDADCDDADSAVNPDATEVCDGVDNDCDGDIDTDATDLTTYYADNDGDGYGGTSTTSACDLPSGYADNADDCDDGESASNPGETEVCDDIDNDCDGDTDEGVTTTWYLDFDSDGYGGVDYSSDACTQPSGYVSDSTDCDDGESAANPGETEVCDDIDNDCDGTTDEDDASDAATWYEDADSDDFGNAAVSLVSCDQPSGHVSDDTDCDDTQESAYPGAPELYDSIDNDCDGDVDEDLWLGSGADGDLEVTDTTDLSADASGSRTDADAATYAVSAISGTAITVTQSASGLDAGDEVLIVNLHGSDDDHAAVGTWEFASVDSVSGTTITLEESLSAVFGESSNADLTDQSVSIQRVPHYEDVTVYAAALLTTTPWDGEQHGVLAFRAAGTVTIEDGGSVSTDELGYWGGETGTCNNCDAFQGESYAGEGDGDTYAGTYNESIGAYAANYGGGGANVTGGGGEHSGGATAGDSWTGGSYTAPEAGDTYGESDLTTIFFGSGGGGVWNGGTDDAGEDAGPGGNGGGVVYIGAAEVVAEGSDAITAIGGTTDHWADGSYTYGAGGGAGGSIYLIVETLEATTDSLNAIGGDGESTHIRLGGDGGDGRVRIDFTTLNGYSFGSTDADAELTDITEPDAAYSDSP